MDSGLSTYEKILTQCKSNDVDAKVEALSKLQAHFGKGGTEVPDSEALINVLKSSLRTSNVHLTNATLSVLPVVLPSLITRPTHIAQFLSNASHVVSSSTPSVSSGAFDLPVLRSALAAFLPAGGVIDRLGDKERAQTKAREILVLFGGYAFRAGGSTMTVKSGKGQETPLAFFERVLKEAGLSSKVWKVREQSILTLVHIRRAHHLFPIRPYLVLLVDCLEDTDAHVRDCARQSVVELFTGPAVNDAARADLKKEMAKKGVRKAIVDDVLGKLLNKVSIGTNLSNDSFENGETTGGKKEYIPPSLALQGKRQRVLSQPISSMTGQPIVKEASRPASRAANASPPLTTPSAENADITPVYIASSRDLENEFAAMQKPFEGKETEHNWAAREQAVQRVRGMLKGDVHNRYPEPFLLALKDGFIQWSFKTLASLRTTVAINTCLLYAELAVALGSLLDSHCEALLSNLLKMSGFTKKLTAQQSQMSVTVIISHSSAQPRLVIPLLWTTLQEKNVQARSYAVAHFKHYLEMYAQRSKYAIEASGNLDTLEKAVKKSLADPNPGVKDSARTLYWVFADVWKERGVTMINALDPAARKQLEKLSPFPGVQVSLPSTPDGKKKSSVAAVIAASRAKAKAIATAPPTLRHQATSNAAGPRGASSSNTSPMGNARARSPLRPTSPPSPLQLRLQSTGMFRSTSVSTVPSMSHTRRTSGGSEKNPRSISPASSDSAHHRMSSPLTAAATGATIRKAISLTSSSPPSSPPGQMSPTQLPHLENRNGAMTVPTRPSLVQLTNRSDESLLMAQSVPLPDDSESEDGAIDVLSFSAAYNQASPDKHPSKSPTLTLSPTSDSRPTPSNALSTGSIPDINTPQQHQVVEDALRARAEQAESAAERLLELVEPEDDLSSHPTTLPFSLLRTLNGSGNAASKPRPKAIPIPTARTKVPPQTPDNKASLILQKAALFADSPAQKPTSLLDVLRNQKQETGWWMKRKMVIAQYQTNSIDPSDQIQELENIISALESGVADVESLKSLSILCWENTVADLSPPRSPQPYLPSTLTPKSSKQSSSKKHAEIWEKNKTFDRFFKSLMSYLQPTRTEEELAYGLIVAWEVLENLSYFLDGKESELFSMILRVRYCNMITVLEGTNAIRDSLTSKLDPVYGLTTLHGDLKVFDAEPAPSSKDEEIKSATHAFGLMAIGKFILRLPAEIAEEELPRLKTTLISSLNNKSSLIVRESAAAAIIAAQLVLRDETHLFTLLDGLADEKKNLLTYLFDKHGARNAPAVGSSTGMDKLEREMRRLDTRTSTPLRGGL